jgi:hypothetical protein
MAAMADAAAMSSCVATAQLWTLLHLRYTKHVIAGDGESGSSNQCSGKRRRGRGDRSAFGHRGQGPGDRMR